MRQLPERKKEMMLKLGKLSSAVVMGCLLCLALFSTGAFAQSAGSSAVNNAAQGVMTHDWGSGWGNGCGSRCGNGCGSRCGRFGRFGRFEGFSRITRVARETRLIRVTRIIRVTRWIRVTREIRES